VAKLKCAVGSVQQCQDTKCQQQFANHCRAKHEGADSARIYSGIVAWRPPRLLEKKKKRKKKEKKRARKQPEEPQERLNEEIERQKEILTEPFTAQKRSSARHERGQQGGGRRLPPQGAGL
jgi:hypothetical protein